MLVKPCARVSWISLAMRLRSSSTAMSRVSSKIRAFSIATANWFESVCAIRMSMSSNASLSAEDRSRTPTTESPCLMGIASSDRMFRFSIPESE